MTTNVLRAGLLAALVLLPVPSESAPARRTGESFHWSGTLAPGKTLRIRGIRGDIRAVLAPGRQAVVDARKWGNRSDPDRVRIEVHEDGGDVTICARYPKRWGGLTDCENVRGARGDVRVEFQVQVPAGVAVAFTNVNGAIRAEGLRGPARAATVNGSVRLETAGTAEAKTVNGSIVARLRPSRRGEMEFASVNGSIRIEIPEDSDARVRATTVNGGISSDFPVTVKGRWVGRRLSGTIGEGGPLIKMTTVNGSISLRAL